MKTLLKFAASALLGLSLNARAANLDITFSNDFGSVSNPVNEVFLWMDPGVTDLSIRGFGGTMSGWRTTTVVRDEVLRLSGPAVTTPNSGRFTARFSFSGPASRAPSFSFQWAEVFFDGVFRHVRGAGTVAYSGGASGSLTDLATFTHLNTTDIPNLAPAPAPVPVPNALVLMLSALVFTPLARRRRRIAAGE